MFIPFELVPVLLGKDYTAQEAFQLAYPLLEAEGLNTICAPFLAFLQAASTSPSTNNPRPVTLQDELGLPRRVTRPTVVRSCRESVIYRLLPDLRPTAAVPRRLHRQHVRWSYAHRRGDACGLPCPGYAGREICAQKNYATSTVNVSRTTFSSSPAPLMTISSLLSTRSWEGTKRGSQSA
jgi:hypothetical protein